MGRSDGQAVVVVADDLFELVLGLRLGSAAGLLDATKVAAGAL
jgi:hypothetical protein